jgi:segregation and condensation protein B
MSLKAKIEAVIYASEEPVTLAQLVGLLGQEAQAELDRAAEAQQRLALVDGTDSGTALAVEPTSENPDVGHPAEEAGSATEPEVSEPGTESPDPSASSGQVVGDPGEVVQPTLGDETAKDGAPAGSEASEVAAAAMAAKAEKARAARLRAYFRELLDALVAEYATDERGLEIREVAGGFRFATKPEYHDAVRGFVKSLKPPLKLSLQALETLAVVAYKQPVTSPEISEIRGVDSSGVLGSLIARKLITTAGRKQVIGRPILYKTTKEFLLKFGLKDVAELPSIEEFERMAGQMAEQEDIPMGDTAGQGDIAGPHKAPENEAELEEERDTHESQADGEVNASDDEAPADNLRAETGDKASVDGRLSSLPPDYSEDEKDDPSAQEAEIQERE